MQQIEMNFVTAFLCCRAAVNAMADRRGRAHRQCRGAAGAGMAQRRRHGRLYREQGRGRGADRRAGRGGRQGRTSWSMRSRPRSWIRRPTATAMPKADHAAWPKVEEVAATILFLASPDNKVTRGGDRAGVRDSRDAVDLPLVPCMREQKRRANHTGAESCAEIDGTSSPQPGGPSASPRSTRPRCAAAHRPRGSSRCRRDRRDSSPSARATGATPRSEVSASQLRRSSRAPLPRWKRATGSSGLPRWSAHAGNTRRPRAAAAP